MADQNPKKFSFRDRYRSFSYAFSGILEVLRGQHNFRIHLVIALLAVAAGFILEISLPEWALVILCIGVVLSAEIFNTAIELLVDVVAPGFSEKAGKIKDLAAAAVLVCAAAALVAGTIIFLPRIYQSIFQ